MGGNDCCGSFAWHWGADRGFARCKSHKITLNARRQRLYAKSAARRECRRQTNVYMCREMGCGSPLPGEAIKRGLYTYIQSHYNKYIYVYAGLQASAARSFPICNLFLLLFPIIADAMQKQCLIFVAATSVRHMPRAAPRARQPPKSTSQTLISAISIVVIVVVIAACWTGCCPRCVWAIYMLSISCDSVSLCVCVCCINKLLCALSSATHALITKFKFQIFRNKLSYLYFCA